MLMRLTRSERQALSVLLLILLMALAGRILFGKDTNPDADGSGSNPKSVEHKNHAGNT